MTIFLIFFDHQGIKTSWRSRRLYLFILRPILPAPHLNKNQIFIMAFVCAENFFMCAQLGRKLFLKNTFSRSVGRWSPENSKLSNKAENGVNRLCVHLFLFVVLIINHISWVARSLFVMQHCSTFVKQTNPFIHTWTVHRIFFPVHIVQSFMNFIPAYPFCIQKMDDRTMFTFGRWYKFIFHR